LCGRIVKRRQIASKLGISVEAVTNCRKRLNRKLEELGRTDPGCCPAWVIEEIKGK
jgi:predicted nucleotidyltransferase